MPGTCSSGNSTECRMPCDIYLHRLCSLSNYVIQELACQPLQACALQELRNEA